MGYSLSVPYNLIKVWHVMAGSLHLLIFLMDTNTGREKLKLRERVGCWVMILRGWRSICDSVCREGRSYPLVQFCVPMRIEKGRGDMCSSSLCRLQSDPSTITIHSPSCHSNTAAFILTGFLQLFNANLLI